VWLETRRRTVSSGLDADVDSLHKAMGLDVLEMRASERSRGERKGWPGAHRSYRNRRFRGGGSGGSDVEIWRPGGVSAVVEWGKTSRRLWALRGGVASRCGACGVVNVGEVGETGSCRGFRR
jgi:hypothetical protein